MKNSLKKDFNRRLAWHNNRSSAVFPIFSSKKTRFYNVFQNYWRWKNNFKHIFVILRIRNKSGETISTSNIKIKDHNDLSQKVVLLRVDLNVPIENNRIIYNFLRSKQLDINS